MRIVGLPEFGSSVRRPSAAVSPAEKITPSQEVAARAREAEAPVATSQIASGREVPVDHDRVAEIAYTERSVDDPQTGNAGDPATDARTFAG